MKEYINYLKLNKEELYKLHQELLVLLIEVDRICRKYDIKYSISSGTLLGAIRHKGFIPWDDDADIHMLRKEYERFCEVCKEELNTEKFFLQNQQTDKNYNWVYGKLRLKNTIYHRVGQEHLKQESGIFIDIFPIDNISDNNFIQYFFEFICKIHRKELWAPVGCIVSENMLSKCIYKALSMIPRNLIISAFNFFAKFYNNKDTTFLVSNNLEYRTKRGYALKREWYDNTLEVEFEGYKFYALEGYDQLLSLVYGDYMTLPSENQRKGTCPASYIKFSDGIELSIKGRESYNNQHKMEECSSI